MTEVLFDGVVAPWFVGPYGTFHVIDVAQSYAKIVLGLNRDHILLDYRSRTLPVARLALLHRNKSNSFVIWLFNRVMRTQAQLQVVRDGTTFTYSLHPTDEPPMLRFYVHYRIDLDPELGQSGSAFMYRVPVHDYAFRRSLDDMFIGVYALK